MYKCWLAVEIAKIIVANNLLFSHVLIIIVDDWNQTSTDGFRMDAKNYLNQILHWKRDTLLRIPRKEGSLACIYTVRKYK